MTKTQLKGRWPHPKRRLSPFRFTCRDQWSDYRHDPEMKMDLGPAEGFTCSARCVRPVKVAHFRHPDPREGYAILHPSSKAGERGKWQVSYFDDGGPYADSGPVDSCSAAVTGLIDRWGHSRLSPNGRVVPKPILVDWK